MNPYPQYPQYPAPNQYTQQPPQQNPQYGQQAPQYGQQYPQYPSPNQYAQHPPQQNQYHNTNPNYYPTKEEQEFALKQMGHMLGTTGLAMTAVIEGKNPVSVMSHGMATMPGMDPSASAILHNFGSSTDAVLPPENRAYAPVFVPPQVSYSSNQSSHVTTTYSTSTSPQHGFQYTTVTTSAPPQVVHQHQHIHHDSHSHAMDHQSFHTFKQRLENESFSSGKISLLQTIATTSWFTSTQVKELIKDALSFSSDRVKAVDILYPRVVDKQNFLVVEDAMDFESEKKHVRKVMQTH